MNVFSFFTKSQSPQVIKPYVPTVTLGWDGEPTVLTESGHIYPRVAELIFHKKYYPNYPEIKWPTCPETGEKLKINVID